MVPCFLREGERRCRAQGGRQSAELFCERRCRAQRFLRRTEEAGRRVMQEYGGERVMRYAGIRKGCGGEEIAAWRQVRSDGKIVGGDRSAGCGRQVSGWCAWNKRSRNNPDYTAPALLSERDGLPACRVCGLLFPDTEHRSVRKRGRRRR